MKALLKTANLAALAFAAGASLMPATVLAAIPYERHLIYYDGPDSTNIVGYFDINCNGRTRLDGQRTPWYSETQVLCEPLHYPPL